MNEKTTQSTLKTSITPGCFTLSKFPIHDMLNLTLGKSEFEQIAANIIKLSQEKGSWVGIVFDERQGDDSWFPVMVEQGFMSEEQIGNTWVYDLTRLAVEKLFVGYARNEIRGLRSDITHLERQAKEKQSWLKLLIDKFV